MKHAIWTPDGVKAKGLSRVEIPAEHIGAFREFASFARHYQLGMHCGKCGKDLVGKNADYDRTQSVVCECREFVALNNGRVVG